MNIFLIRHGEKEERVGDVDAIKLTVKGHRQANLVGQRLKNENIKIICSSTMTRSKQTSDEINKYLHVNIEYRTEIREIDMGECDNKGWDYVFSKYPEFKKEFEKHEVDVPYPLGECGEDVWIRSKKVLDEVISLNFDNVAIVAHGGTIRSIICGVLGIPQAKRFLLGLPPEHCSISLIKYDNNKFFLHTFNDYAHLGVEL